MKSNWTLGAMVAVGIGMGVALAEHLGPAGYAAGIGAAILAFGSLSRGRPHRAGRS